MSRTSSDESGSVNSSSSSSVMKNYYFAILLSSIAVSALIPTIPFMVMNIGGTPFSVGLVSSAFSFGAIFFTLASGHITAKVGPRFTIYLYLCVGAVAGIVAPLVSAVSALFILRFLTASCVGIEPLLLTAIARGRMANSANLGVFSTAKAIGLKLGPSMAAIIGLLTIAPQERFSSITLCAGVLLLLTMPLLSKTLSATAEVESTGYRSHASLRGVFEIPGMATLSTLRAIMGIANGVMLPIGALLAAKRFGWTLVEYGFLLTGVTVLLILVRMYATMRGNLDHKIRSSVVVSLSIYAVSVAILAISSNWIIFVLAYLGTAVANAVLPVITTLMSSEIGPSARRTSVMSFSSAIFFVGDLVGSLLGGAMFAINMYFPFLALAVGQGIVVATCYKRLPITYVGDHSNEHAPN